MSRPPTMFKAVSPSHIWHVITKVVTQVYMHGCKILKLFQRTKNERRKLNVISSFTHCFISLIIAIHVFFIRLDPWCRFSDRVFVGILFRVCLHFSPLIIKLLQCSCMYWGPMAMANPCSLKQHGSPGNRVRNFGYSIHRDNQNMCQIT